MAITQRDNFEAKMKRFWQFANKSNFFFFFFLPSNILASSKLISFHKFHSSNVSSESCITAIIMCASIENEIFFQMWLIPSYPWRILCEIILLISETIHYWDSKPPESDFVPPSCKCPLRHTTTRHHSTEKKKKKKTFQSRYFLPLPSFFFAQNSFVNGHSISTVSSWRKHFCGENLPFPVLFCKREILWFLRLPLKHTIWIWEYDGRLTNYKTTETVVELMISDTCFLFSLTFFHLFYMNKTHKSGWRKHDNIYRMTVNFLVI